MLRREPLDQLVNTSVNQTLGRTIITSSATFLAVFALYVFGGEVLRAFAFTMLVGVVTGTYSTVFIAASHRDHPQPPDAADVAGRAAGRGAAQAGLIVTRGPVPDRLPLARGHTAARRPCASS